jgi:hypothetical protein
MVHSNSGVISSQLTEVSDVARNRQVYIELVVEALPFLPSFYLGNEQILIDTTKHDRQIVLPIPLFSWSCLAELSPVWLSYTIVRMYEYTNLRIATETRPIRSIFIPSLLAMLAELPSSSGVPCELGRSRWIVAAVEGDLFCFRC